MGPQTRIGSSTAQNKSHRKALDIFLASMYKAGVKGNKNLKEKIYNPFSQDSFSN